MITFEEKIDEINYWIAIRKKRWTLAALAFMDYDDVSQIIRTHIYEKWALWNQERPLKNWLNRVITNQTRNIIDRYWSKMAPPCKSCPHWSPSDNLCYWTKSNEPDTSCPLYNKWVKGKKNQYEINFSSKVNEEGESILENCFAISNGADVNYENSVPSFHREMLAKLSPKLKDFYRLHYIEEKTEQEICELSGVEYNSATKFKFGQTKKKIYELAKTVVRSIDLH